MDNNKIQTNKRLLAWEKVKRPFIKISYKLEEQFLTVSDVLRILKLTRRQLFYWDSKGMKLSEKKTPSRSWRKFSITDLLGFAILNELRELGVQLDRCKSIVCRLREVKFSSSIDFIYRFAEGERIFLETSWFDASLFRKLSKLGYPILFPEQAKPHYHTAVKFYDADVEHFNRILRFTVKPHIILTLDAILRSVLRDVKRQDFYVEFEKDRFGEKNRTIFYVNGDRMEFKLSEEEAKVFLRRRELI